MSNKKHNHSFSTKVIIFLLMSFILNATPIKIMPLGDSITEGDSNVPHNIDQNISDYSPLIHPNDVDKISYRGKLWDLLKADGYTFNGISGDLDFVGSHQRGMNYNDIFDADNEGHGGWTSKMILDYISDWLDQNLADIVLLHIGTNDPVTYIPIGSYDDADQNANTSVNNVRKILDTIFAKNPDAKVMVARIIKAKLAESWELPLGPNGEPWTTALFNDKIVEMVNHHPKQSQIRIVDMENGAGLEYDHCGLPHDMQPYHGDADNTYDFHPTANGYTKMAQKWYIALRNAGWLTERPYVPADHLWSLNEAGSPFGDTGGDDAVCSGRRCPTQISGKIENAQQFNGAEVLNAPMKSLGANESYSIGFWIKADATTGLEVNMAFRENNGYKAIWIGRDGNQLKYELPGGPSFHDAGRLSTGWNYVVITKDASSQKAKAYINGVQTDSSQSNKESLNTTQLYLGAYDESRSYGFKGSMDEVALYESVLSPADILANYNRIGGNVGGTDTTPPVIILKGNSSVTLTVGDAYTDAGATATDNKDGDLTANIETISNVDTTKAGTYRVTYNVSDAAENAATQTRTVTVKAEGNEEDPVTGSELISNAKANWKGSFSMLREYQGESYLLTGNEAYSYTYKPFATEAGSTYRVTATLLGADESRDENFAGSSILAIANAIPTSYKANEIAVSQSVGGSTPQEVTFTFTATGTTSYAVLRGDSAWKYPNLKTFSVKKVSGGTDTTPPVIILKGNSSVTLTVGDAYTDAGATATDNKDGDLTANIETISNVDTTKAGTYRVTYNVSDAAENAASAVSRTVIVKTVVIDSKIPWDHGNLKISSDNRMLQHEDGTGFFWMADTAWVLYRKTKEDIDLYIKNRAKKKFTVIQAVVMHYSGSSSNGESPFVERDLSLPNEKYWKHIDYMISKAAENNMYVALLPTWHSAVRYGDFKTTEDARKFGIWIAKRYKNRPNIIWMIGGDTPIDGSRVPEGMTAEEEVAIWNALGSAIDGVDTNHLITFHPLLKIPSVQLGRPEWLDFNLLQSGRGSTGNSVLHLQKALREGLAVVDGESLYEDLAYARKGESDRRTAFQVRDDAYSQLFAGAFGNTYGHDAIFRFWESEADPVCENWICTPRVTWREALDAPGGSQMQYVTELMQSRPLVGRVPDQSMISGSPAATEGKVATHGVGYGMVYLSLGGSVTVVMGKVSGAEVKAWWYNPRDGSVMEIAVFSNSGTQTFQAPDQQDWVLVLDDMSKGYGKPGE